MTIKSLLIPIAVLLIGAAGAPPCFAAPVASAEEKTDREKAGLLGPVETVVTEVERVVTKRSTSSNVSDESAWTARRATSKVTYNADGDLTSESEYDAEGSARPKKILTYDPEGTLVQQISPGEIRYYDRHGNLIQREYSWGNGTTAKTTFAYHANGECSDKIEERPDGSRHLYAYGIKGNLIRVAYYNPDGSFSYESVPIYKSERNRFEVAYPVDSNGQLNPVPYYKSDASLSDESVPVQSAGLLASFKDVHAYDEKGHLLEWARYDVNGSLRYNTVYTYDSEGNIAQIVYNHGNGTRTVHIYGAQGKVTQWMDYNSDGSVRTGCTRTYDTEGNRVCEVQYGAEGHGHMVVTTFDAEGRILRTADYNPDRSIFRNSIHEYDAMGNPTEVAWYNARGSLHWKDVWVYEYDPYGNWTKRAQSIWPDELWTGVAQVTYRTITYCLDYQTS